MHEIADFEFWSANTNSAVCGERHDSSEDALYVNTNFGFMATSMPKMALQSFFLQLPSFRASLVAKG
jgi:hypothetical protein